MTGELGDLQPGRALDAGCGHGAETLWLVAHGWQVTAVDFSATALAYARATVERGVEWVEADLGTWAPEPDAFDLVVCVYVHVAGSVVELVQRLAAGVVSGGTLFMVGRIDAPGQRQVTVADARAALDPEQWELLVAAEGVDAVVRARRAAS